jgi:hypothetical protein
MKKIILFTSFFCLASVASHLSAQSINNKNWKAFFGEPFNDTLTLHIHSDSSFVTKSNGEILVRSNCMIKSDTLTLSDYGSGEYVCTDMIGKYKITVKGNTFIATLIDDPCEGRAHALDGIKWTESSKK